MKAKKMTGSDWSAVAVFVTFAGAIFAWIGTRVSGQEARARVEAQLALTQQIAESNLELKRKADEVSDAQKQLRAQSEQIAAKSNEISKLNREIADTNKKFVAFATGANSFLYLHVRNFGGASPEAHLVHVGENPVRDTEILVHDVTDQVPALVMRIADRYDVEKASSKRAFVDAVYPIRPSKLTMPMFEVNPSREMYAYFVYISGANGTYRQILQLVKVGQEWKQAYLVQAVLGKRQYSPVGKFFDEGFPDPALIQRSAEYPDLKAPE